MANIKKYRVEHTPTFASIEVSIDYDYSYKFGDRIVTMEESIKEQAMFWHGSNRRLKDNSGSYLKTFLKHLCETIMIASAANNLNEFGIIDVFNAKEGWCGLDGSRGIKLLSLEPMEIDNQEDYEIDELK